MNRAGRTPVTENVNKLQPARRTHILISHNGAEPSTYPSRHGPDPEHFGLILSSDATWTGAMSLPVCGVGGEGT